ncbi:MAG: O-acetyltransferase WecH [Anaerolineales bacterium]|nr:O-acetyltransferase WecH [Anaerolineales bacterium]
MAVLESPVSRSRVLWVDIIRAVSAFGVIFTHVTMIIVNYWDKKPLVRGDEAWWTISVFYAFLARSALGLFFMISGYLLLPAATDTISFLRKRLWKLLVPLAFWGTFYLFWRGEVPADPVKAVKFILSALASGETEFHLWFLYTFIGIYLFVPTISVVIRYGRESDVWYYVAVWFLLGPIFGFIYWTMGNYIALTQFGYFSGFIGFFLLGYLLARFNLAPKWIAAICFLLPLWAAAETWGFHRLTRIEKVMPEQWFDTLTVFVVPYTALMFLALKGLGQRIQARLAASSKVSAVWEALSRASLGIILIHVFVLEIMYKGFGDIHLAPYDFNPALSIPIVSIVSYLICFTLVYAIQRVPILKNIVAS